MHYEIEVGGRIRHVDVRREGDGFAVTVDGRPLQIDAARINANSLSLLVDSVSPNQAAGADTTPGTRRGFDVAIGADPAGSRVVQVGALGIPVVLNGRRRWGRRDGSAATGAGPQRLLAPMPGKIV